MFGNTVYYAIRTTITDVLLVCVCCVLVPSSVPLLGVSRNLTSTSILVSWYAPVEPNGEIIEYAVVLQGPRGSNSTYTADSQLILTHLTPYTAYNLSISAVNRRGMGPSLMLALHTDEAGESKSISEFLIYLQIFWMMYVNILYSNIYTLFSVEM